MSDTEAAAGADEDVPVVYLHDVSRRYKQGEVTLTILDGAKLALWAGQSVALVAPSGAGKSTLLHIAGLLEHPDEGEVYLMGTATTTLTDLQRTMMRRNDVGFVYQSHRLLPEFTALENVMMPQLVRGLSRNEASRRAEEILSYLGLKERAHAPAVRTVRRRAAARRDRARRRQRAAHPVCRRADRQPRPAHRRACVQRADAARPRHPRRHADRHPQHGARRQDGPPRHAARRPGGRAGLGAVPPEGDFPAVQKWLAECLFTIDDRLFGLFHTSTDVILS